MCDALSRNVPKLPAGVEILLANYLAHGRRQFVDVAENFSNECCYVLEMLGQVYLHDAEACERSLTPEERLRLHQYRSRPVMDKLHAWLEAQLAERRTEPNSGLGQAIGICCGTGSPRRCSCAKPGARLITTSSQLGAMLHVCIRDSSTNQTINPRVLTCIGSWKSVLLRSQLYQTTLACPVRA